MRTIDSGMTPWIEWVEVIDGLSPEDLEEAGLLESPQGPDPPPSELDPGSNCSRPAAGAEAFPSPHENLGFFEVVVFDDVRLRGAVLMVHH